MNRHITELTRWFEAHHSVITRRQARRLGLTSNEIDGLLATGKWQTIYTGVFRLAGAVMTDLMRLQAAVLASGPDAMACHRSAAWLWGLVDEPPTTPTVLVPPERRVHAGGIRSVRTRHPARADEVEGIKCTSVVRTIVDCAGELAPEELDALVDIAIARRLVRISDLTRALKAKQLRNHRGRARLADRLAARGVTGSPHPSVLESHMSRLLRRLGLPVPKAQVDWGPNRCYRLDFAYPKIRLAIEVDGWAHHFTPEQQRYDLRRRNRLTSEGWKVLHYTWWDVTREPDRVAEEIAAVYRQLQAA
jgi:very-short-patch-repair endonuclease/predicted transcriptional regulator of viral defense system